MPGQSQGGSIVGPRATPERPQVPLREMATLRDPLYREVADLIIDTDAHSPAETTAQLVVRLAAQWQNPEFSA